MNIHRVIVMQVIDETHVATFYVEKSLHDAFMAVANSAGLLTSSQPVDKIFEEDGDSWIPVTSLSDITL